MKLKDLIRNKRKKDVKQELKLRRRRNPPAENKQPEQIGDGEGSMADELSRGPD